ncbi:MAG: hypothetical protein JW703_04935 [Candidatus Diapherotrites archaeon]|nr:hypothetical protein [Candidatus Diapherotrites archaeon]
MNLNKILIMFLMAFLVISSAYAEETNVCEGILGDVDGDGVISVNDAELAFQMIFNGNYNPCADLTADGLITAGDIQGIYALIPATCSLLGDVDGDQQLTCMDSYLIFQYVLGFQTPSSQIELCGDITQNGIITTEDAQTVNDLTMSSEGTCSNGTCNAEGQCIENQSCELIGDVDGDGVITQNDAELAFELVLNNEYNPCADMNEDGVITAGDAQAIYVLINQCTLLGDVDNDGYLTCADVQCIFDYVLGMPVEETCPLIETCGDLTQDGIITAEDSQQLMIQEELECNFQTTCSLLGDVDGDQQLTCMDSYLVFQYLLGFATEINVDCADITQNGSITAEDAQEISIIAMSSEGTCSNGTCNAEGQCIPNLYCGDGICNNGKDCSSCPGDCGSCGGGSSGGGSSGGGGGSGSLRVCEIEDVIYTEWNECVDGIQTREYSMKYRCKGDLSEQLELERTCIIETEVIELSEKTYCENNNPCIKPRVYNGKCVYEWIQKISCYESGIIGVCQDGKCVVPVQEQQEIVKEITENTNTPTGFFGLGLIEIPLLGFIFLILLILGYTGYKKMNSKPTEK